MFTNNILSSSSYVTWDVLQHRINIKQFWNFVLKTALKVRQCYSLSCLPSAWPVCVYTTWSGIGCGRWSSIRSHCSRSAALGRRRNTLQFVRMLAHKAWYDCNVSISQSVVSVSAFARYMAHSALTSCYGERKAMWWCDVIISMGLRYTGIDLWLAAACTCHLLDSDIGPKNKNNVSTLRKPRTSIRAKVKQSSV